MNPWLDICSINQSINCEIWNCTTCFPVTLQMLMSLGYLREDEVKWILVQSLDFVKEWKHIYWNPHSNDVNGKFAINVSGAGFDPATIHSVIRHKVQSYHDCFTFLLVQLFLFHFSFLPGFIKWNVESCKYKFSFSFPS